MENPAEETFRRPNDSNIDSRPIPVKAACQVKVPTRLHFNPRPAQILFHARGYAGLQESRFESERTSP